MFLRSTKLVSLPFLWMLFLMTSSCEDDSEVSPSASVKDVLQTVDESIGTASVTIDLGKEATESMTINYQISGSAVLNGDFEVTSGSSLVIAKGARTATLNLTIFDDQVLEDEKSIIVNFSSDDLQFTDNNATIQITDNEPDISASGLQVDLTWDSGKLVNLNLYTAHNVVIGNDDSVESFDLLQESIAEKGFESILINNKDQDDQYYIVINYAAGSRDVKYKLNYNGPSITNVATDGSFAASNAGYAIFYGPIDKSGSTYSKMAAGASVQPAVHIYKEAISH